MMIVITSQKNIIVDELLIRNLHLIPLRTLDFAAIAIAQHFAEEEDGKY